jgi:predicted ABC-type transport system involved in lysophospholipase L1 biosynthesis ATPase subunit
VSVPAGPVFALEGISKVYGGLRPLRVQSLVVPSGAVVALVGLDAPAAETLVNLLTGATLPDAGEVRVFGRATADITDADDWLGTIDRFGIVSDRAVLLDELTAAQNLAMTLTLEIDPLTADVRQVVEQLSADVSLDPAQLDRKVAVLSAAEKLRIRLGRAVALAPAVLLLEHPPATLPRETVADFAALVAGLARTRQLTVVALTADAAFAAALTREAYTWVPADGSLVPLEQGAWTRVKRLLGGRR